MKGVLVLAACIFMSTFSMDAVAAVSKSKSKKSNVYAGKKYKHKCPKPRKVINAVYF